MLNTVAGSKSWSARTWTARHARAAADDVAANAQMKADRWLLLRWDRRLWDLHQPLPVILPAVLLLLATLAFRLMPLDLAISGLFHHPAAETGFPLVDSPALQWLYWWGLLPTWLLFFAGVGMVVAGLIPHYRRGWCEAGLFLVLLLVIGPGLLVNVVYKEHWGRPRPEHVTAFGGDRPFLRVLQPGSEPGHSFPSGHAAAGFYLIGPAFLIYRRRPRLAAALFVMGLMAGTTIGLGRIIQGRHFASDVLWSAGIVYFTALGLDYLRALFPMPATVATPWRRGTANRGRPIAHDASTATKPTPAEPRRRDAA